MYAKPSWFSRAVWITRSRVEAGDIEVGDIEAFDFDVYCPGHFHYDVDNVEPRGWLFA